MQLAHFGIPWWLWFHGVFGGSHQVLALIVNLLGSLRLCILHTGQQAVILVTMSSLVRLCILIQSSDIHHIMVSMLPVKTVLESFKQPAVVIRARWASLPRLLFARQIMSPHTAFVYMLRFDVVIAIALKERALLLPCLTMPSILHHDLVIRWLGAIILLPVREILLRLLTVKIGSFSHYRRPINIFLSAHLLILHHFKPLLIQLFLVLIFNKIHFFPSFI